MRRALRAVLVGLFGASAAACYDPYAKVVIFNDTRAAFAVRLPRHVLQQREKVSPDHSRSFSSRDISDELVLAQAGCVYRYRLPLPDHEYFRPRDSAVYGGAALNLQVEPDWSVMLMPVWGKLLAPAADLQPFQRYGYPVRPISKRCA